MSNSKRIVILGAGPAGLSAALWLRNLGFAPCVADTAEHAGGLQNLNFLANDWVLGQPGQTGPVLAQRFVDHARGAGVPLLMGVRPLQVTGEAGRFLVRFDSGEELDGGALLIATGTRYRAGEVLAGVDGIADLAPDRVAYGPYAFADLAALVGKRVLIVGGGDNAFENARLLAPRAAMVHLAVRGRPRAQQGLAAAVAAEVAAGCCRVLGQANLLSAHEGASGLAVTVALAGREECLAVDRIHVLAGYEPNTAFIDAVFDAAVATAMGRDAHGYLLADGAGRTGVPGVYTAGDVCNPTFPSVVSAIAQGALVAKTIELDGRAP
jgi:thioredoxin reductase (NADPH)